MIGKSSHGLVTASGEDYLEAVLMLQQRIGMVRSVDIARHMGLSKPSVSHGVRILRKGGFLRVDEDYCLHLTEIGYEIAKRILERHLFFWELLIEAGVDPQLAEQEACQMEHTISQESFERIRRAHEEAKRRGAVSPKSGG